MGSEANVSTLSGIGVIFILMGGVALLVLPRRYVIAVLFIVGCYMTLGQVLMIGPFHFSIFRIFLFLGWLRILVKGEISTIRLNSFDYSLLTWVIISSAAYVIARGSTVAVISRLGWSCNVVGAYFLYRALVNNIDDIILPVKILCFIIIPLAVIFIAEYKTGRNIFSVFGSVPEITVIREGKIRCQGPFAHPILAGTFAATTMPLFVGLWSHGACSRLVITCSILSASIIVFLSSSSGPILAYLISVLGLVFWPLRRKMRSVRWCLIALIATLTLFMKAPVWYLIARMSEILGMGTGWHRSALIDAAINHFDEWWLVGTTYTAHWMPTYLPTDPNNADITNQFIAEGVNGGFISMCLFIWLLVKSFSANGVALRNYALFSIPEQHMIWAMGCALLSHVASFFSVPYFDQIILFWYWLLAAIVALGYSRNENKAKSVNKGGSLKKRILIHA